jgi:hypothetical protein
MRRLACILVALIAIVGTGTEAAAQTCSPRRTLGCGDTDHWANDDFGTTEDIDGYSCTALTSYAASEYTYAFVAPGTGDVTVTLSGLGADLDLFVLVDADGECDPDNCEDLSTNGGSADDTVTFAATEGETYYFVVDGFAGATSEFDIDIGCDFPVRCEPAREVSCGDSDTWGTNRAGHTDRIVRYSCSPWTESGPEYAYSFTAPATGSATVSLTGMEAGVDLDIFVLDAAEGDCDPTTCIAHGERTATFDVEEGHEYHLVVDGYFGDEGNFTLNVNCELDGRCSPSDNLVCGETVTWNNEGAGSSDMINTYGWAGVGAAPACISWTESGPEYAYSFIAPVPGSYSVEISGMEAGEDLDIYVLEGDERYCDPTTTVACGNTVATWTASAGTLYYIVVDGYGGDVSDYDLTISCPALDVCVPGREIACGASISAATTDEDASDNVDIYSCSAWSETGPEMAYTFSPRITSDVTATLLSLDEDQDLDLFVLTDAGGVCEPEECLTYGRIDDTTTFRAVAGETYYVVVDGYRGAAAEFELELDCAFGCEPRLELECDSMELGNNSDAGSTDRIDSYSCVGWAETGPEYAYSFTAPDNGVITVSISDMTADLDIFVITEEAGECDPGTCLAYGENEVTFGAEEGQTYFIVVDGYRDAVDDYIIELTCGAPACDQDRDGSDATGGDCGGDDCDDDNADVHPGAEEICGDDVDQDCNGTDLACADCTDADGDGHGVGEACEGDPDCDDTAADIYPGAEERCGDGIDQDCNGEDLACPCNDRDGDGWRAGDGCSGEVDCDDTDDTIYPEADEICNDGIDQDCNGSDEACPRCNDRDGDGYGEGAGCRGTDCDDFNPAIYEGAAEVCGDEIDQDCNGSDLSCPGDCTDPDGDGYGEGADCLGPDCMPDDPEINPGARDDCDDGIDQDCDGEDATCGCDDDDGDGYADATCGGDDCDDSSASIYPGAEERCSDGIDQDCDGSDEECPCGDADGDGYNDRECGGDDCADDDPDLHPNADDPCGDGIDQNCDGIDDCPCEDLDGDGYGAGESCVGEEDCDDTDPRRNPGADDICGNGVDEDCDGQDQSCICSDDNDSDGHISTDCGGDDCDDSNAAIHAGATETVGNGVDDNCNGVIDEVCSDEEICDNGVDDDCDGMTDEETCSGAPTSAEGCNCRAASSARAGASQTVLLLIGLLGLNWIARKR